MALTLLGVAAFVEYKNQQLSGRDDYIRIALDHIAALFAIASSFADFNAVIGKQHDTFKNGVLLL